MRLNKTRLKLVAVGLFICGIIVGFIISTICTYIVEQPTYFEDHKVIVDETDDTIVQAVATSEKPLKLKSLGLFTSTAYCVENYPHICNDGDATTTSTGTTPTPGRTIAVDPRIIPYGQSVIINGHTYIAEDCGGAIKGKRIDIAFKTHKEALEYGEKDVEVFIYE